MIRKKILSFLPIHLLGQAVAREVVVILLLEEVGILHRAVVEGVVVVPVEEVTEEEAIEYVNLHPKPIQS
ncbi:hypothetical protein LPTSP2_23300 [Leptospira ellinghausenii]|uniref:Uncharacterized protein n=1 Tax=Leptospira ellinghausenii TaxID=1917822 RepID=A0A2P2DEI0_9LEPT|nr:hypothetical protein LPTSP2_23300 [Leptospira ellinghausenii]